ncbi:hypothetical protein [Chromobacterium sp. Beijing]|uniref:hypothetical protein n=1 Tax=Chromobacterium sp. Beijing TaxID=2735795 RepID=UPI001F308F6D|nr:hypothetical protein [Chromobacterium sp. Beijing]UJB32911.1 hypothetical protein HQN78_18770 [Chromobacterium sp. Beijing]
MKKFLTILALLSSNLYASDLSNKDVKNFIDNAETCEHLSGEISGDNDARQREVIRDLNKYCNRAMKQQKRLLIKYKANPEVVAELKKWNEVFGIVE